MQFYEPFIIWRALKKIDKEEYKQVSWQEFYAKQIASSVTRKDDLVALHGHSYGMEAQSLSIEHSWLKEGCPYYKIWPGVFDQFASTRMDIDTKFLKAPHNTFAIYFPKLEDPLISFKIYGKTFAVSSILVSHFTSEEINQSRQTYGLMKSIKELFNDKAFSKLNIDEYNTSIIKIRIEFKSNEFQDRYFSGVELSDYMKEQCKNVNPPGEFFRNVPIISNATIEDVIGEFVDVKAYDDASPEEVVPASVIETCFRILIGIYFVSTGSQKVLEYDVLSKHLEAYRKMKEEENSKKVKEYEIKARQKGKYGWNVGVERKDRHLILPRGMTYEEALREAGSRKLLYQHTRGGHWHLYWIGSKGSQKPVVKWVEETTVKPDLPIRPLKR